MYELKNIKGNTYYIDSPSKVGIYQINETDIYLIDSGNDKDAAKKIAHIIEEKNWNLIGIINTHSHADHIGGNAYLSEKYHCPIYTSPIESCFVNYPILEPTFLYGGNPSKPLKNKFLMAKESCVTSTRIPLIFETIPLKGHCYEMIGIKTKDDVIFLADCLSEEEILKKYPIFFLYDVKGFIETLDLLETLEAAFYLPSHVSLQTDIKKLIAINRFQIFSILEFLLETCKKAHTFEQLLKIAFDHYQLEMNWNQYTLVGSTLKAYLTYLLEEDKITSYFEDNQLFFFKKD